MKIAFFGTPAYAVPSLNALVEAGHEVVTVVAQPNRPSGRGKRMQAPPVAIRAQELGIHLRQPRALRSGPFFENYQKLDLDLAVVIAYGRILPKALLNTPRLGSWNAHGSLLPRWRGAAPIERAVQAGDTQTGVCIMQMDEGLDTGPVLLEESISIGPEERAIELRDKLSALSAQLLVKALSNPQSHSPTPQTQDGLCHADPMTKQEGLLDFSKPADVLHNQIRAFYPWPGSHTVFRGEQFKIHRAKLAEEEGPVGEVLVAKKKLVIGCGTGAIEVLEAQLPGKKALPVQAILNGARIEKGETMGTELGETND
jgi:methionyl-tRNA formyltransferase